MDHPQRQPPRESSVIVKTRFKSQERQRRTEELHSAKGEPTIMCSHTADSTICQVKSLTDADLRLVHSLMYEDSNKERQDAFVTSLVAIEPVKRQRPRSDNPRTRAYTARYEIPLSGSSTRVKVCAASFRSILQVGKNLVSNLVSYAIEEKTPRPERRGGFRANPDYDEKKKLITAHIESFACKDSHYARKKAPRRQYLSHRLNITKMHALFLEKHPQSGVTYKSYYHVLVSEYNLGFGQPRKDVCSTCTEFGEKLRLEQDEEAKRAIVAGQALHQFRAKKFYKLLQEEQSDNTISLCFDLMQNQELPRTPVGEAYYSRQQWQYFLGIVRCGQSETTTFYTWGEHEAGRGANEIGSAFYHYLTTRIPIGTVKIRLFSDNCAGQNKNFAMLAMLAAFASSQKIEIEYFFPIRGHSYLPADRAFGRVEKRLRSHETILLPRRYFEEFRKEGDVLEYGVDWPILDLKVFAKNVLKSKQSFLISESRRLKISGCVIQTSDDFHSPLKRYSILKRGKDLSSFKPADLVCEPQSHMKDAKKRDVLRLLSVIGVDERHEAYSFYARSCGPAPDEEDQASSDSSSEESD